MVTSGPRGWSGLEVEGFGRPFLRIANVPSGSIALSLHDVAFIDAPVGDESDRCRVQSGDVLMTITAAIGQVAVVPGDLGEAYISQHLALLRPNPAVVMPEWLALALWSDDAQRQLDAARYGGTKQQLSLEDVREVCVPFAEMTVQRSVVPRVVASLEAVTQAEQRIGRMIDLIIERRQSLITAAVTGQIEIPGVAA
jgi:type I restriction enzyme S subunit